MTAPGFFGKLPAHGDFVGRRLPATLIDPLDAWLQRALLESRHALGDAWLPAWLESPIWRFVLTQGVCGARSWSGVMMPSADRVGRCFPLVLAAPGLAAPALPDCLGLHAPWFARLEDLALSALEEGFSIDGFDAALLALDGAPGGSPAFQEQQGRLARVAPLAGSAIPALACAPIGGSSAWWTDGSQQVAPCLAVCAGLPQPAGFAAMLDGAWPARGWDV